MKYILNALSAIVLLMSSVLFPVIWIYSKHPEKMQLDERMFIIWGIIHILTISYISTQYLLPPYNNNNNKK